MSHDVLILAHQGHVHELVLVPQLAHAVEDVGLVVGPLDAELSAGHDDLYPDFSFSSQNPVEAPESEECEEMLMNQDVSPLL